MAEIEEPISIRRPQRWDIPFGSDMDDKAVDRLLATPPFSNMDTQAFPPKISLRGVLKNDTRILQYQDGEIVVREGDYGSSAFLILSGAVRVLVEDVPFEILGRREPQRKGVFSALAQLWRNPKTSEVRDVESYAADSLVDSRAISGGDTHVFLQDFPEIISKYEINRIETGAIFGELAALGRSPRNATVVAEAGAELLEIRWQGLRELRRRAKQFKEHIDTLYRERALDLHLRETPILKHLSQTEMKEVAQHTRFESYGDFEWYTTYKTMTEKSATQRLEQEPLILEEGYYPKGLVLIRSGFARVSTQVGSGHRTVSYLGRGQVVGFDEVVHNWRSDSPIPLQHSLRAVGYVDVLFIPTWVVEKFVLPSIPQHLLDKLIIPSKPSSSSKDESKAKIGTDLLEFLVEERFINGTATMMINLDRCVHCDECVRACATTHDNNPRFIRHGKQFGKFMVANACMHCQDPVCMIGCPTGAIHRDSLEGSVVINDATCIGCTTCANSCPYSNIRMVEIRDRNGRFILDQQTNTPIVKATKCDLCIDQLGGPACQRACPHDALIRMDMQNTHSLADWVTR